MSTRDNGIELEGGNLTPVVRIGNTVRRVMGPWSPAVHSLLLYLEKQRFDASPRFLGVDDQGREILSFIEGEVGNYPLRPYMWSDETLALSARLLKRYHEAVAGYVPQPDARWQQAYPDASRHEIICHNDFAPYNLVFADRKPVGLIDFDVAGPGPRLWDVAYAAYTLVPLSWVEDLSALGLSRHSEQVRRLKILCDEYGMDDRNELSGMVEARIQGMIDFLLKGASDGNPARIRLIEEGHLVHYRRELEAFRQHRDELEKALE